MKQILLAVIILTGCGPRWHIKQAEKHILKAEAKGSSWKRDTILQTIQVPVPEIRVDSTIVIKPGDSVIIYKDRLEVKYKRLKGDTVFIEASCLPDTLKVEVVKYINNELNCPKPKWRLVDVIGAALIALIAGFVLGRVIK